MSSIPPASGPPASGPPTANAPVVKGETQAESRVMRRDKALIAAIVAVTALALFGGYVASRGLAMRVTEAHALNVGEKFTRSLANSLTLFDPSGRFVEAENEQSSAVHRFAQNVAHIDRIVVVGQDRIVAYDSAGLKTGSFYDKPYIADALTRDRATVRFADRDDIPGPPPGGVEEPFVVEAYVPARAGGRVVGVFELYLDVSDYVTSVQQVFRLAYVGFVVAVIFATLAAVWLVDRSMRRRLNDLRRMQELRDAAEAAQQSAERSLAQQQRFTANAAHELRTPLAVLRARLDGLEPRARLDGLEPNAALPPAAIAALGRDVDRMARLVEQLLAMARLEARLVELEDNVDLRAVASETIARLFPLALADGKSIALEAPDAPALVRGNGFALEDALRNLIDNALRHSPAGETVEVKVIAEPTPALEVCDRGPGAPQAMRAHLFEPFVHGRETQGPQRRGAAGLGLAIVAETAALHGGSASVADRDGGGAIFRLTLPMQADAAINMQRETQHAA